jgi:hypothetical protein
MVDVQRYYQLGLLFHTFFEMVGLYYILGSFFFCKIGSIKRGKIGQSSRQLRSIQ